MLTFGNGKNCRLYCPHIVSLDKEAFLITHRDVWTTRSWKHRKTVCSKTGGGAGGTKCVSVGLWEFSYSKFFTLGFSSHTPTFSVLYLCKPLPNLLSIHVETVLLLGSTYCKSWGKNQNFDEINGPVLILLHSMQKL